MLCDLEKFDFSYGDKQVLKDINLKIDNGEKIAIIGSSGAGKSTLLEHLSHLAPQQTAHICQKNALIYELNSFNNVYMGRLDQVSAWRNFLNLLRPDPGFKEEIHELLKSLHLDEKISTKTSQLSGGEQQRVAIARALFRGGEHFVGDEPVSAVDPHLAEMIIERLYQLPSTVILSLHSVNLALRFAKRIIGIKNGQIFFDCDVIQVKDSDLQELYLPC